MAAAVAIAVLVLSWSAALASPAAAQVATDQRRPDKVVLVYDDQSISDSGMAAVVRFVSRAVPVDEWDRAVLKSDETIERFVDRLYDYYPSGDRFARPLTARALRDEILRANPRLSESPTLRIPPLPVRAKGDYRHRDALRLFSPASRSYGIDQVTDSAVLSPERVSVAAGTAVAQVTLSEANGELRPGSAQIAAAGLAKLQDLTASVVDPSQLRLEIQGLSASASEQSLILADRRAHEVQRQLFAREKLPLERMRVASAAETPPLPPGTPFEARIVVTAYALQALGADQLAVPSATTLDEKRNATSTGLVLDTAAAFAAGLELPPDVVVLSATAKPRAGADEAVDRIGYSRIEFLESRRADCSARIDWLRSSRYFKEAAAKIEEFRQKHPGELKARAARGKLILLDFDFTGAGHGSKVREVALHVLDEFGLRGELQGFVEPVEFLLRDDRARTEMKTLLTEYAQSNDFIRGNRGFVADAERWIDKESANAVWTGFEIHDLVAQALIWKHLREQSVLNMSFRLYSPALRLMQPQFTRKVPRTLVSVAAGNEAAVLAADYVPQDSSIALANFVNVSHGFDDGRVLGTRGGTVHGQRSLVSMAAPGCGFEFGVVSPQEAGSSLASPVVATTAWIKALLGGGIGGELRAALLDASVPVPLQHAGIESGGFFDAARLIAGMPRPALVLADRIESMTDPRLIVQCLGEPDGAVRIYQPQPHLRRSIVLTGSERAGFRLWERRITPAPFPQAEITSSCTVVGLQLTVSGAVRYSSPSQFAAHVQEVLL